MIVSIVSGHQTASQRPTPAGKTEKRPDRFARHRKSHRTWSGCADCPEQRARSCSNLCETKGLSAPSCGTTGVFGLAGRTAASVSASASLKDLKVDTTGLSMLLVRCGCLMRLAQLRTQQGCCGSLHWSRIETGLMPVASTGNGLISIPDQSTVTHRRSNRKRVDHRRLERR